MNYLISEGYIKRQTSNNISILTIVCYDQYQLGNSKTLSPEKTLEPPLSHLASHVQSHPFEPPCDENPSHIKIPIIDCLSVIYELLKDESMSHLEMGITSHPFEPEDEPPFDEKASHPFVPPITPSLEEKINNNLNNKKYIIVVVEKRRVRMHT